MLPAVLAAAAALLLLPTPSVARLQRIRSRAAPTSGRRPADEPGWWTSPWAAGAAAGLVVWWFVGGWLGPPLGVAVAFGARTWVAGLERSAVRRRRERVTRDLPLAVDLVVAALASGRPPAQALRTAAEAIGGPLSEDLLGRCGRIELGADPGAVWAELANDPVLGGLGRALGRAHRSGASVVEVLEHLAADLRRGRRALTQQRARSVGVRTAVPLGLCFLPAFALVAVVPAVAALLGSTLGAVLGP